ncbi:MAG: hypothetical protein QGH45_02440 [Myxococcota bacterium]|jgi:hypothetical protein|nr:hypothetical protein [Myxococcota bacterium]
MDRHAFEEILERTLADRRISRSERRALGAVVDDERLWGKYGPGS